jgi:putative phosphoesterase
LIAIISDIHGNYPALRAVLDEIDVAQVDRVICLGDVAGYYSMLNECVAALRDRAVVNILGNHDYYLLHDVRCERSTSANSCLDYQRMIVSEESLEWLSGSVATIEFDGVRMVHGGWNDYLNEYLYEVTEDYFRRLNGATFFSGHTHIQMLSTFSDKLYCNPGSVGQPRDGNSHAAFAIWDGKHVVLKRVEYDICEIANHMRESGFGPYYYENLYEGRTIGKKGGLLDFQQDRPNEYR